MYVISLYLYLCICRYTICSEFQFESKAPGRHWTDGQDRECRTPQQCDTETQYESAPFTSDSDRTCTPITVCKPGTFVALAATTTRNRLCEPCPVGLTSSTDNAPQCVRTTTTTTTTGTTTTTVTTTTTTTLTTTTTTETTVTATTVTSSTSGLCNPDFAPHGPIYYQCSSEEDETQLPVFRADIVVGHKCIEYSTTTTTTTATTTTARRRRRRDYNGTVCQ